MLPRRDAPSLRSDATLNAARAATLATTAHAVGSARIAAAVGLQRTCGNQAVLRMLGRPAPGAAPATVIQRKPVPRLVGGKVYWYDDTDPEEQLFDSAEACAANGRKLGGGGALSMHLPDLDPLGPPTAGSGIVKLWEPPRASRGQDRPPPSGLLPIFDIRSTGKAPARTAPSDPLVDLYLKSAGTDILLADAVLTMAGRDVFLARRIMDRLVGDVRTMAGARLVHGLLAHAVAPPVIDALVARGLATATQLAPLVPTLVARCSPQDSVRLLAYSRLQLEQLLGYAANDLAVLLQYPPTTFDAVLALSFTPDQLSFVLAGMSAASLGVLAQMLGLNATHIVALCDFGAQSVSELHQVLSMVELLRLLTIYASTVDRQGIAALLTGTQIGNSLQGEVGRRNLMRRLLAATAGAQITGPLAALGDAVFATLLAHLTPPQILPLQAPLANVPEAEIDTSLNELTPQRYVSLVLHGVPHATLPGLFQFGAQHVDQMVLTCTAADIGQIRLAVVDAVMRIRIGELIGSGLTLPDLVGLTGWAGFPGLVRRFHNAQLSGAQIHAALLPLGAAFYLQVLAHVDTELTELHTVLQLGAPLLTQLLTIPSQFMLQVSRTFNSNTKRAWVQQLQPALVLQLVQGAIGQQHMLGRLVRITAQNATQTVTALGQAKFATCLHVWEPATVFQVCTGLQPLQESTITIMGTHLTGLTQPRHLSLLRYLLGNAERVGDGPMLQLLNTYLQYLVVGEDVYRWIYKHSDKFQKGTNVLLGRAQRLAPEWEVQTQQGQDVLTHAQKLALSKVLASGAAAKTEGALNAFLSGVHFLAASGTARDALFVQIGRFSTEFARDFQYRERGGIVDYAVAPCFSTPLVTIHINGVATNCTIDLIPRKRNHILSGHTYKYFNFKDDNIDRSGVSSMFPVGTTVADMQNRLTQEVQAEAGNIFFTNLQRTWLAANGTLGLKWFNGHVYVTRFFVNDEQCTDRQLSMLKPFFI
jgi:hypothetical protein